MGTPSYMSPEIFSGARVDGRSDLFSLGVILYQLLTGQRPFAATTVSRTIYRVLYDEPAPPSRARPGISPLWDIVCARLLAKKPGDRYRSAKGLIGDLDALERGTLVGEEPTQPIPFSSTRPGSLRRWVAAALIMGVALVGWFWMNPTPRQSAPQPQPPRSMGSLFADAERAREEGRIDEGEALLNAITAHHPDYPDSTELSEKLERDRFRESLPMRFVARHEHRVGHCTGDLLLRADGIAFETSRHGTWRWPVAAIERLTRVSASALSVRVASQNFDITFVRPQIARGDFERYRAFLDAAGRE